MTVLISVREHDIESPASLNRSHPNGSRSGMKRESSRVESGDDRASSSRPDISRRAMLKSAATALGGGAGTLVGGASLAATPGQSRVAAPARTPSQSAQVFRGYVRFGNGASVQELRLLPIAPREVVVRTEAAQVCYTTTAVGLGTTPVTQATIPAHGGVGIVIEVGSTVDCVQVGDRVIVAGQAQCGSCYNCLRGRADTA